MSDMSSTRELDEPSSMLKKHGKGSEVSQETTWYVPTGPKRKARTTNDEPSAKRIQSAALAAGFGADKHTGVGAAAAGISSDANTSTESASVKVKAAVARAPPKNPDACLSHLPTELLMKIVGYLSRRSLSRLSQMSRKLYGVAVSPLYEKGISSVMSKRRRHGLVATVSKNSELAKMVKSIEVVYTVRKIDSRQIEDEANLMGREARLLGLALNAATNVQELTIKDESREATLWHKKHDFWWIKLLVSAAQGTPVEPTKTFANLKTLNVSLGIHISGWLRLEKLSSILRLPSLEDVTLGGLVEGERIANWDCPEGESNVKKLALENSFLMSEVVVQLLSSCKELTHFTYGYSSTDNFEPFSDADNHKYQWAEHSWAVIGEQLQRHKNTVQALNLFYDTDPFILDMVGEAEYNIEPENLGSLKGFEKLGQLAAPIDTLVPQDADPSYFAEHLPKRIESLDVRFDALTTLKPAAFSAAIDSLATNRSESLLRTLHISIGDDVEVDELKLIGPVTSLTKAGVKTLVTRDPMHRLGQLVKEIHDQLPDGGDDES